MFDHMKIQKKNLLHTTLQRTNIYIPWKVNFLSRWFSVFFPFKGGIWTNRSPFHLSTDPWASQTVKFAATRPFGLGLSEWKQVKTMDQTCAENDQIFFLGVLKHGLVVISSHVGRQMETLYIILFLLSVPNRGHHKLNYQLFISCSLVGHSHRIPPSQQEHLPKLSNFWCCNNAMGFSF